MPVIISTETENITLLSLPEIGNRDKEGQPVNLEERVLLIGDESSSTDGQIKLATIFSHTGTISCLTADCSVGIRDLPYEASYITQTHTNIVSSLDADTILVQAPTSISLNSDDIYIQGKLHVEGDMIVTNTEHISTSDSSITLGTDIDGFGFNGKFTTAGEDHSFRIKPSSPSSDAPIGFINDHKLPFVVTDAGTTDFIPVYNIATNTLTKVAVDSVLPGHVTTASQVGSPSTNVSFTLMQDTGTQDVGNFNLDNLGNKKIELPTYTATHIQNNYVKIASNKNTVFFDRIDIGKGTPNEPQNPTLIVSGASSFTGTITSTQPISCLTLTANTLIANTIVESPKVQVTTLEAPTGSPNGITSISNVTIDASRVLTANTINSHSEVPLGLNTMRIALHEVEGQEDMANVSNINELTADTIRVQTLTAIGGSPIEFTGSGGMSATVTSANITATDTITVQSASMISLPAEPVITLPESTSLNLMNATVTLKKDASLTEPIRVFVPTDTIIQIPESTEDITLIGTIENITVPTTTGEKPLSVTAGNMKISDGTISVEGGDITLDTGVTFTASTIGTITGSGTGSFLEITNIDGDVTLNTVTNNSTITTVQGDLAVATVTGDIQLPKDSNLLYFEGDFAARTDLLTSTWDGNTPPIDDNEKLYVLRGSTINALASRLSGIDADIALIKTTIGGIGG